MASHKRLNYSFNERVRVRLFGLSSSNCSTTSSFSGSEHEGENDIVSPSPCLSYLVQNFLEADESDIVNYNSTNEPPSHENDSDSETDELIRSDSTALINNILNPMMWNNADIFRNKLLAQVTKAVEIFSFFRKSNKSIFHRNLMAYLREIGYNAGVCKTKWTSSGNLKAGNYEFLDVVTPENHIRYIIDTEFSSEFEIVRESNNYQTVRTSLPQVFVGELNDMKKIVRLMCDEGRRSMKLNCLSLPPWRKHRYMQMKWFGPYRRSTSHLPPPTPLLLHAVRGSPVKCRAVGFDLTGLYPPVTRTR